MRWLSRFNLKGPVQGTRSLVPPGDARVSLRRRPLSASLQRHGLRCSLVQAKRTSSSGSSASSTLPRPPSAPVHPRDPNQQGRLVPRWSFLALIITASAGIVFLYRRRSGVVEDDVINTSTFSPFMIVEREEVSPSAFIITLRPRSWVAPEALDERRRVKNDGDDDDNDKPSEAVSTRIQEAWRHGLWSVEIKQPQLQIARHYTPLPPLHPLFREESSYAGGDGDGREPQVMRNQNPALVHRHDEGGDLRILIRRMNGGEMSNYLARQRVGDTVWLRGPHLGFNIPRRLGTLDDKIHDDNTSIDSRAQRAVVFLAGGTGIAPALQIAHRLLDGHGSGHNADENKPHVSILWANRSGADAVGRDNSLSTRQSPSRWFNFWTNTKDVEPSMRPGEKGQHLDAAPVSSLASQIEDLKRRHRSHFTLSYFVDNERSFIGASDLEAALASTRLSPARPSARESFVSVGENCTWHSAKAVERLPDDNDAARSTASTSASTSASDSAYVCTCAPKTGEKGSPTRPGVNLLCVSGPDGFIEAYAGAKRWDEGSEMQGALRGLIGGMRKAKGEEFGEWLVLKL